MSRCENARALLPRPRAMARILGRMRHGSSHEPPQARRHYATTAAFKHARRTGKLG